MELNLVVLFIPCLFFLILIEYLYSWYRKIPVYSLSDSLNNFATGISNQIFIVIFHTVTIAGYLWIYDHWRIFDLSSWPNEPMWWMPKRELFGVSPGSWSLIIVAFTWIVCLFAYELAYYWNHRLSHEINFLWAGHIVHHQSEEYNLGVAFRQASFRGLFTWVFYLPLAWIGFPPVVMILIAQLSLIYQFLIHTRFISKLPHWFESIFNTPSHHRVHHGRNLRYINKNYGGMFIFFDHWFGTFEPEGETPIYGITDRLESFNPLWANVHYWWEMILSAKNSTRWKDRLKVFYALPGWKPDSLKTSVTKQKDEEESSIYKKYNVFLPAGLAAYSLFWSLVAVSISFFVLWKVGEIPAILLHTVFFAGILAFVCMGGVCDRRKWVLYVEPIRLIYVCFVLYRFFGFLNVNFVLIGFHFLSLIYFLTYYQSFGVARGTADSKKNLIFP